ncbi:TonB-dependent receptor plug domain-containing protein [Kordiimonas gwangyangensis]|uniref:TonB-dependent receptor plug domain-containing protein n=1 Tax=Kordiimonas gwangyangensis TaxID=288022 RepID=UPI000AD10BF7|nr:TonB-dependent receptor [Kordiimonas gwangyangensis]
MYSSGGYNPTFGAKVKDFDTSVGVRGDVGDAFNWDISGRIAESSVDYFMDNTINPSLGRLSPTSFKPGSVAQRELGLNADMVSSVDVAALASPLNIAFGAEYRRETYEITAGDKASYIAGPTGQIFGVGSDGFQGDSPDAAGVFNSSSYAFYLDLETDLTSNLTVAGALRYENFDKFGDTIDWKISSRLQLSESLALRGTLNTGFRAPTPGQANTLDVTTNTDSDGNLVPLGTFPVEHPAAVALGAQPLTPEQSFNITAGLVFTGIKNTTITVDYYNIDVNDRIALRPITIADGSSEQQALINSGVLNAEQLAGSLLFECF